MMMHSLRSRRCVIKRKVKKNKVIQIVVSEDCLFALCENGRIAAMFVNETFEDSSQWSEVAEIPENLFQKEVTK